MKADDVRNHSWHHTKKRRQRGDVGRHRAHGQAQKLRPPENEGLGSNLVEPGQLRKLLQAVPERFRGELQHDRRSDGGL